MYSTAGRNDGNDEKKEPVPNIQDVTGSAVNVKQSVFQQGISTVPGVLASLAVMQVGTSMASNMGQCLLSMQGLDTGGPSPISAVPVAIVAGMMIGNSPGISKLPKMLDSGLSFAKTRLLQAGVVCIGAKLSAMDLLTTGLAGIPCVALTVGTGLLFIPWLARKAGLSPKMGSLIAAGTSICGITAISAVSPAIKATPQETSVAVANVVAFGTFGMLAYPYLAYALFSSTQQAGLFLGLAVHDTSQVLGSALTYSSLYGAEEVLKVAAVTKLTRNVCLAGVVPYMTYKHASDAVTAGKQQAHSHSQSALGLLTKYVPGFVAGFIGMACMRSVGDFSLDTYGAAFGLLTAEHWTQTTSFIGNTLSQPLLTTAMAAVGLTTSASALKGVGMKPFAVGFAGASVVGSVGFASALLLC
eukprot:CFRG5971T1